MNTIVIGLGLGLVAAILDVLPMVIRKLPLAATCSAFVQWLFLGVVISCCRLGLPGWATGMILGVSGSIPILLAISGNPILMPAGQELKTIIPILLCSLILGTGIGLVSRLISP